jgi:hypothetical protein
MTTTGLYSMRPRWYDPNTRRVLIGRSDLDQTLDACGYCDENPIDETDPSGSLILVGGGGGYGVATSVVANSVRQTSSTGLFLGVSYSAVAKPHRPN